MPESKITQFLLVLFFAGSVVALGAHDLTTRHLPREYASKRSGKMVEELHGATDMETPRAKISDDALLDPGSGGDMDRLGRGDRKQLKSLLDRILP